MWFEILNQNYFLETNDINKDDSNKTEIVHSNKMDVIHRYSIDKNAEIILICDK